MDVTIPLLKLVGKPLATFLLKRYVEDAAAKVGADLIDIATRKIEGEANRRHAQRVFESIGDQAIQHLAPLFEDAVKHGDVNVEAVALELGEALKIPLTPEFFLKRDLDPAELAKAFREAHPFPTGHFSAAEASLYERSLDMAVRCLVEVAGELPRFEQKLAAEQLKRLTRMQDVFDQALEGIGRIEQAITTSVPAASMPASRLIIAKQSAAPLTIWIYSEWTLSLNPNGISSPSRTSR